MSVITPMKAVISVTIAAQNCTSRVAFLRLWRTALRCPCGFARFLVRFLCRIRITSFLGGKITRTLLLRVRVSPFGYFSTLLGQPTTQKKLRPKHNMNFLSRATSTRLGLLAVSRSVWCAFTPRGHCPSALWQL
jgi:hypothetical protein